jgi:hypothetical protein
MFELNRNYHEKFVEEAKDITNRFFDSDIDGDMRKGNPSIMKLDFTGAPPANQLLTNSV